MAHTLTTAQPRTPQALDTDLEASLKLHCGLRFALRGASLVGEPDLDVIATQSTAPDLSRAMTMIRASLKPAPAERLVSALATLSTLTARSNKAGENDADLQLAAYVRMLGDYPEDVALDVLSRWPRRSKFWPTWCELLDDLDRGVRYRRRALAALEFAQKRARS